MTTILVIEDHEDLREDVVDMLSFAGFDVIDAPNGRIGVQVARDKLPNLIICDILMPYLDGHGVLLELRSDPATATIPFIFLTARADRSDVRKGMELGASDYLTKPFTQTELLAAVSIALEKHQVIKQRYGDQMDDLRENLLQALPHELRTPLTGILGYGEMLMEDADKLTTNQIQGMAEMIVKSGTRLYRLIENYLFYAQIEIIKTDPTRLNRMRQMRVTNAGEVITHIARKSALEAGRVDDLLLEVETEELAFAEESLHKIVEELMDNALKFSKAGTLVEVKARANHNIYNLVIRDRGRGLTAEQIRQVGAYVQFERRLHEQQGMGLGLTLAKDLAELHGGGLAIYSEPHHGTEVRVDLPVRGIVHDD